MKKNKRINYSNEGIKLVVYPDLKIANVVINLDGVDDWMMDDGQIHKALCGNNTDVHWPDTFTFNLNAINMNDDKINTEKTIFLLHINDITASTVNVTYDVDFSTLNFIPEFKEKRITLTSDK